MAAIITKIKHALEGQIDPAGQATTELITTAGLVAAAVVAFVAGLVAGDLRVSLIVYAVGVVVTLLVVVPAWPAFNRHPVRWRSSLLASGDVVDSKKTQ